MSQHYYEGRKTARGHYRGVVYHYSNIDDGEVIDYRSEELFESESEAIDDAEEWCDDNSIDAEML